MNLISLARKTGVLIMLLLIASCSGSDDDSGTKVKYEIIGDDAIITNISYRKANGEFQDITNQIGPNWNKTITVEKPFLAQLEVTFNNTTAQTSGYTLLIYVDGSETPSAFDPGIVPPNATTIGVVDFQIPE